MITNTVVIKEYNNIGVEETRQFFRQRLVKIAAIVNDHINDLQVLEKVRQMVQEQGMDPAEFSETILGITFHGSARDRFYRTPFRPKTFADKF
jgi:UDP-N-acetyl-D-mannosaminuronate dehydrogenase